MRTPAAKSESGDAAANETTEAWPSASMHGRVILNVLSVYKVFEIIIGH